MIEPQCRFCQLWGSHLNGGPSKWEVIDFDQRRWFSVSGSHGALMETENAPRFLARHINQLGPDVRAITVSDEGDLLSVSSRPKDDVTRVVNYPQYDPSSDLWVATKVLTRSQLIEVDRLGVQVDLVHYKDDFGKIHPLVFKYAIIVQDVNRMWTETNVMKALPRHDSIVPFYCLVIDDIQPRILGMAVPYISGGTFAENRTRTFRFSWLQQLTSLVDDLNNKFGIMHRDIAPRNLAVDPISDKIQLFDFEFAVKTDYEGPWGNLPNDVDGVILTIYEIFTLDRQPCRYRGKQGSRGAEDIVDWDVKISLEDGYGGPKGYRQFLNGWAQARRAVTTKRSQVSMPLDWPEKPPITPVPAISYPDSSDEEDIRPPRLEPGGAIRRYGAMRNNQPVINWERPMSLEDEKTR